MKIDIQTEFDKEIEENNIQIHIKAHNSNTLVNKIIESIHELSKDNDIIIAEKDNNIYILELDEVVKFFSDNQHTYCLYRNDIYRIKKRLYELEDLLGSKYFIRISNSCIINIRQVECFDMGKTGSIIIKLKNKDIENVSKRRISSVLKFLKEREN